MLLVAAACGLLTFVAAKAAATGTLAGNRAAARRDVVSLLARLRLPPGSTPVAGEPAGDDRILRPLPGLIGSTAQVVRHAWFTAPGTPSSVIAYIRAHPPRAGDLDGTGATVSPSLGVTSQSVSFAFPDLRHRIDERLLQATVTALPGDRTGVLAESDSVWFVPRPRTERVPPGVREVQVTAGRPGRAPSTAATIVDPVQISRIVRVVDGLAPAQPFAINCPAESDPRQIDVRLLAAHAVTVARLVITAFRPWAAPDHDGCGASVVFTIGGRRQAPLEAGTIVSDLQRLAGTTLH